MSGETRDQIERVWNDGRRDAPRWHELTNSERYRMTIMRDAVCAALAEQIKALPRDVMYETVGARKYFRQAPYGTVRLRAVLALVDPDAESKP